MLTSTHASALQVAKSEIYFQVSKLFTLSGSHRTTSRVMRWGGKKWKMPSFKYPYIMGWRNSLAMLRITVMFFQRTKVWVLTPVSDSSESPETATPRDPITSLGLYGHYNIHENTHKLFFFLIYKTILTIRSWGNGTIDSSPADPLTDSFIKPPILTDP